MTKISENNNVDQKVLVSVLAHPDDETFGMGGTLAKYSLEGVDVYLICATRGEVGEMDEKYMQGFHTPSERREYELRCAAKKLGIKEVFFLNYLDSGMPGAEQNKNPQSLWAAPVNEVAHKIHALLLQLKPQVVLTFDPIGGYRHPDHIRIYEATLLAFQSFYPHGFENRKTDSAEYRPQKLYYHTIPRTYLKVSVALMRLIGRDPRKFGTNKDIDLQSIVEVEFPIHAVINYGKYAQLRNEASACHQSQGGTRMSGGIMGWLRRLLGSDDKFMRAYPLPQLNEKKEKDLFAGI